MQVNGGEKFFSRDACANEGRALCCPDWESACTERKRYQAGRRNSSQKWSLAVPRRQVTELCLSHVHVYYFFLQAGEITTCLKSTPQMKSDNLLGLGTMLVSVIPDKSMPLFIQDRLTFQLSFVSLIEPHTFSLSTDPLSFLFYFYCNSPLSTTAPPFTRERRGYLITTAHVRHACRTS